jgi:MtfA peptidase
LAVATPRKPASHRAARRPVGVLNRLTHRRRIKRHTVTDPLWTKTLSRCSYARALPKADRERLRERVTRFLQIKTFEGARGLDVTDAMRVRVALHACIPVLNLGLDYYADWSAIVIYPGDFRVHDEYTDEYGIVHQEVLDLCGQSLSPGPVVLSWETLLDEDGTHVDRDLVIHECAHKLDVLNGGANGFPPLHADMNVREWAVDFLAAYDRLCAQLESGTKVQLDPYAADDPAEFFAVMSETFFSAPHIVREDFPAVYTHLQRFYRQDPVRIMGKLKS